MNKGLLILKWTVMSILFVMLFGWITMLLWNWLIPPIFNGPTISFFQGLGLLVLSKILFSGLGGGNWAGQRGAHWKSRYYGKLSQMSPEDRERFKARMKEKWCPTERKASTGNSDISNG